MTELRAENLNVERNRRRILNDISLTARSGEFIAVIGPNGAGKSTLLTALAGLSRPSSDSVSLDRVALTAMKRSQLARRRAYLPQNPRSEWPISVERLVALGLTPVLPTFGDLPSNMQTQVDDALITCDLLHIRMQQVTTLSGGELARAMLARALVGKPDILIADEPTAGLDPRHALETMRRLRAMADNGTLVITAVHDLTLAARYATRLFIVRDGKMMADGPPADILNSDLLRRTFDVEACVSGTGEGIYVDYSAL